jgi:hypothetical protein
MRNLRKNQKEETRRSRLLLGGSLMGAAVCSLRAKRAHESCDDICGLPSLAKRFPEALGRCLGGNPVRVCASLACPLHCVGDDLVIRSFVFHADLLFSY